MKTVLVTGASGFIGRNVTAGLINGGYRVRAQYRRAEPPRILTGTSGVELARGDLCADGFIEQIVDGVDSVIHTAAFVSMTGPKRKFAEINVDATERLLRAAAREQCTKFVHISSVAVHGFGRHLESDESGPYYRPISEYQRSKKAAEHRVVATKQLPWTILRPGLVYGPGDTTTLKPVFALLEKSQLPLLGGFDVFNCPVYIDDLVHAVVLGLESPSSVGEIFNIVSGEKVRLLEAISFAAELLGKPAPRFNLPTWIASSAALALEAVYRLPIFSGDPLITRYLAAELSHHFHFTPAKAQKLLGYTPRVSWREGLRKAVDAYRTSSEES